MGYQLLRQDLGKKEPFCLYTRCPSARAAGFVPYLNDTVNSSGKTKRARRISQSIDSNLFHPFATLYLRRFIPIIRLSYLRPYKNRLIEDRLHEKTFILNSPPFHYHHRSILWTILCWTPHQHTTSSNARLQRKES